MAGNLSVNVETNGLGTAKVFYGSEEPYRNVAEVLFYPKLGAIIDNEYHYEYTVTYTPDSGLDPLTEKGSGSFTTASPEIVEDENCPLKTMCSGDDKWFIDTVSWKITITGNSSVFPCKVIPDGSGDLIWFYGRYSLDGDLFFWWKCKVALDGYEFLGVIFFYSSDEQIPNVKYNHHHIEGYCYDDGFAKCTFWFRKFTYLLMYDEKSKKLISNSSLLRDG